MPNSRVIRPHTHNSGIVSGHTNTFEKCIHTYCRCPYAYLLEVKTLDGGALDFLSQKEVFAHLEDQKVKGCPRTWRPERAEG